jgi:hypothetical protein
MLTEEVVDEISGRFEYSHEKFPRQHTQEIRASSFHFALFPKGNFSI